MAAGVRDAEKLYTRVQTAGARTLQDRMLRDDLLSAAFALRAILAAGLGREESRGSFVRSDYRESDDARWLRNSRHSWDPDAGRFAVDYVPVETEPFDP
jgi:succinate dehydrogenase/fumarate reductase flavoprotein subunit